MENASEALIMAGQVLIFIIALTICISSFTTTRAGIDNMMNQSETIKLAKNSDEYINYMQIRDNGSTRVVGAETVVSSMYRAIKENYVIYIKLNDYGSIFEGDSKSAVDEYTASKDVYIEGVASPIISEGDTIIKVTIGNGTNQEINEKLKAKFYTQIKDLQFNEYLGEYQNNSNVNSEDKMTYRVITYIDTRCF